MSIMVENMSKGSYFTELARVNEVSDFLAENSDKSDVEDLARKLVDEFPEFEGLRLVELIPHFSYEWWVEGSVVSHGLDSFDYLAVKLVEASEN